VLVAAQCGEPWALRAVYDELAPRVRGYLTARGAAEPEDLTTEVFLAVFPRLPQVTGGPAGLRALVFSVAHARLLDDLRRRARRGPVVAYERSSTSGPRGRPRTRRWRSWAPSVSARCSPPSPTTSATCC
jgi:DNA-directed RNA polymerase specialized sigma24 family protein